MKSIDWTSLTRYSKEFKPIRRYPLIYGNIKEFIAREALPNAKILDIGGADKNMKKTMKNKICVYKSFDIDKRNTHDFYSIHKINGRYNIVLMIGILDHLELSDVYTYLKKSYDVLDDNGLLFIQVSNVYHPTSQRHDPQHRTYLPGKNLYSLLKILGFKNITIIRNGVHKNFKLPLKRILSWALDIDYAPYLLIEAKK
ncbi:hypothetical protein COT72_03955 [archaeon CG10_big_fil_rev_8_21_14_0_10_43_11]|nr:MAG: hypothetical protein COT72_03955 [archaeon CG10_big_fil_rev_8_21_14_0_10_43_11]